MESARLQLHTALDTVYDHLVRAQSQTRLAMSTLAEVSHIVPLAASGLEPLMTLDADYAERIALLDKVREEVDEMCDVGDLATVRRHLEFLHNPGARAAAGLLSTQLN